MEMNKLFVSPIKWSDELIEFQTRSKSNGYCDLKILCDDGYFMVDRLVFAMSSNNPLEIEKNVKNGRLTWKIPSKTVAQVAPVIILAYTGEILVVPSDMNSPVLRQIVKAFQFKEDKLHWSIPFKGVDGAHEDKFASTKVRACLHSVDSKRNGKDKDVFIFGNGTIQDVPNDFDKVESNKQGIGIPCKYEHCNLIFTSKDDYLDHFLKCKNVPWDSDDEKWKRDYRNLIFRNGENSGLTGGSSTYNIKHSAHARNSSAVSKASKENMAPNLLKLSHAISQPNLKTVVQPSRKIDRAATALSKQLLTNSQQSLSKKFNEGLSTVPKETQAFSKPTQQREVALKPNTALSGQTNAKSVPNLTTPINNKSPIQKKTAPPPPILTKVVAKTAGEKTSKPSANRVPVEKAGYTSYFPTYNPQARKVVPKVPNQVNPPVNNYDSAIDLNTKVPHLYSNNNNVNGQMTSVTNKPTYVNNSPITTHSEIHDGTHTSSAYNIQTTSKIPISLQRKRLATPESIEAPCQQDFGNGIKRVKMEGLEPRKNNELNCAHKSLENLNSQQSSHFVPVGHHQGHNFNGSSGEYYLERVVTDSGMNSIRGTSRNFLPSLPSYMLHSSSVISNPLLLHSQSTTMNSERRSTLDPIQARMLSMANTVRKTRKGNWCCNICNKVFTTFSVYMRHPCKKI